MTENYDWNEVMARLSVEFPDPSGAQFSDPFGTQHFSQTQQMPMDHVPQWDPQYGQHYDPAQYGYPSGPGESSHIQDDAAEPVQTRDFTPLAHGREQRDVHPPPRYTPSVVSCLFYNLVNIKCLQKISSSLIYRLYFYRHVREHVDMLGVVRSSLYVIFLYVVFLLWILFFLYYFIMEFLCCFFIVVLFILLWLYFIMNFLLKYNIFSA